MESESRVESKRPAVFRGFDGAEGVGTLSAAVSIALVKLLAMEELEALFGLAGESRVGRASLGEDGTCRDSWSIGRASLSRAIGVAYDGISTQESRFAIAGGQNKTIPRVPRSYSLL